MQSHSEECNWHKDWTTCGCGLIQEIHEPEDCSYLKSGGYCIPCITGSEAVETDEK